MRPDKQQLKKIAEVVSAWLVEIVSRMRQARKDDKEIAQNLRSLPRVKKAAKLEEFFIEDLGLSDSEFNHDDDLVKWYLRRIWFLCTGVEADLRSYTDSNVGVRFAVGDILRDDEDFGGLFGECEIDEEFRQFVGETVCTTVHTYLRGRAHRFSDGASVVFDEHTGLSTSVVRRQFNPRETTGFESGGTAVGLTGLSLLSAVAVPGALALSVVAAPVALIGLPLAPVALALMIAEQRRERRNRNAVAANATEMVSPVGNANDGNGNENPLSSLREAVDSRDPALLAQKLERLFQVSISTQHTSVFMQDLKGLFEGNPNATFDEVKGAVHMLQRHLQRSAPAAQSSHQAPPSSPRRVGTGVFAPADASQAANSSAQSSKPQSPDAASTMRSNPSVRQ